MRFSPHLQLFYFSDRLEFCEFFEWKIKRINNTDLFSQTPFLTFIKGANISGGHCMGSVILDTSKTVATEMEIKTINTWIMFPSLLPQIWKFIFLF